MLTTSLLDDTEKAEAGNMKEGLPMQNVEQWGRMSVASSAYTVLAEPQASPKETSPSQNVYSQVDRDGGQRKKAGKAVTFGQLFTRNRHPSFERFYVNYYRLKNLVRRVREGVVAAEDEFNQVLEAEWAKFDGHYREQLSSLNQRDCTTERDLKSIMQLNEFAWLNHEAVRKIVKAHDGVSTVRLGQAWQFRFRYSPHETVLRKMKQFSDYQKERMPAPDNNAGGVDQDNFSRTSFKYWVKPQDVISLVGICIKHLPIYCFKKSESPLCAIKSVYFDDKDKGMYSERLSKGESARVFRIRWYDDNMDTVFIERKVHHMKWVKADSSKNRFSLKGGQVMEFLRGNLPVETVKPKNRALFTEVQKLVLDRSLFPSVRTCYDRMAFQHDSDNSVRVSLDLHLEMIREHTSHFEWFTPSNDLREDDIYRFPFTVCELKLCGDYVQNPPPWVRDLMTGGLLKDANGFGKFATGTYMLEQTKNLRIPFWIDNNPTFAVVNQSERGASEAPTTLDNHKLSMQAPDNCLAQCFPCVPPPYQAMPRVKIEPKTFFSNERTFMSWFQAAIIIEMFGISLLATAYEGSFLGQDPIKVAEEKFPIEMFTNAAGRVNIEEMDEERAKFLSRQTHAAPVGYVLCLIGLLIIAYAGVRYYIRDKALLHRQPTGYRDAYGPPMLAITMFAGIIAVLIIVHIDPNALSNINASG